MECLFKIIGLQAIGNKIKLLIVPIETEDKITSSGILKNPMGFIDDLKSQSIQSKNPDSISIPVDAWKERKLGIGDMLKVNVEGA